MRVVDQAGPDRCVAILRPFFCDGFLRHDEQAIRVPQAWLTLPTPHEFAAILAKGGFTVIEDIGAHDIETRYGIPAVHFERMALARKDALMRFTP